MRNVSDKSCRDNQNTHFVFNDVFPKKLAVYQIMWENIVESGRPQMAIWRMRFVCWIPKATNTHPGYVILILLFHCSCYYTNTPRCYVTRTLSVM